MKVVVFATLAAGAAAFAPNSPSKISTALGMSYENELGVIAPTGYFDPLGLSANVDKATFDQYRTAELKHGRVAMLCVIGYITQEIYRFPGEIAPGLKFADVPNGVAAINAIPALGWAQIVVAIGATDYYGFLGDFETGKGGNIDPATLETRKLNEIQHGRLAMLASMELLRHDSQNLVQAGFDGYDHLIVSSSACSIEDNLLLSHSLTSFSYRIPDWPPLPLQLSPAYSVCHVTFRSHFLGVLYL